MEGMGYTTEFTPNLRLFEVFAHLFARFGQRSLCAKRARMRGAEDPPSPLNNVLQDGHGFEHVVACVEIPNASRRRREA